VENLPFALRCALAFASMVALDIVWVIYMRSATSERPFAAGLAAAILFLIAAWNVLNYTKDSRLVYPCALGAFVGTFLGVVL
jgi:flagellar motor component MotA